MANTNPQNVQGYRWMYEPVPDAILDRTAKWLDHVGLGGLLTRQDLTRLYQVSEKQRNTLAGNQMGVHDPLSSTSNVRLYDPTTMVHEAFHNHFEQVLKDALKAKGIDKPFTEALAFLVEVAGFGNQQYARELLAQSRQARSPYQPDQDTLGNLLIYGFFVGGQHTFPIVDGILNGKNPQEYRQQIQNFGAALHRQLESPASTLEMLASRFARGISRQDEVSQSLARAGVGREITSTDPQGYLSAAFTLPDIVSAYIVEQAGFLTVTQAATSLAEIKIEALDAFRAIASRLYILAGYSIDEAEKAAAQVVVSRASKPIMDGLSTLEENIAAMHEFGIDEQTIQDTLVAGLTRPGYTLNMKWGLREVLKAAGDMPKVGGRYFQAFLDNGKFREFMSAKGGANAVNSIKQQYGAAIAQETLEFLLGLPMNFTFSYSATLDLDDLQSNISRYSRQEELALWKNMPAVLALLMVHESYWDKGFVKELTGGEIQYRSGFRDKIIPHIYDTASAMQGDFSDNVLKVVSGMYQRAQSFLEQLGKPAAGI